MYNENDRQANAALNSAEAQARKTTLASTPLYVTIGTHYACNARCLFCLGGDYPDFTLDIYKALFEKKMGTVLRNASHVGFCGFGETLLMPDIERFLDHVNLTLPAPSKVFTTNGFPLKPRIAEKLTEGNYAVLVSLHASTPELHQHITRTDFFDTIIRQIRYLNELKTKKGNHVHLNLVFLATTLNIENLPSFVRLAHELGADRVSVNYLTMFDPVHVPMTCFFQQEKTNAMFDQAQELADQLNFTLVLPPRFNQARYEDHPCHDPWNFFYVETQGSVNPCCFAGNHIGYLNKEEFENIWNGPGYTRLREGLRTGTIHSWCKYCYRFRTGNVNDIRSHITFRPETQEKMLRYLKEKKHEYPLPEKTFEL